jgi:hypothetical protein
MSQHLNLLAYGKAAGGQARVRTTFGKSDRVGSQGGLRPPARRAYASERNVDYGGG